MSEILPGVHVLQIKAFPDGSRMPPALNRALNLCLLVWHERVTLVDAGMAGVLPALQAYLGDIGLDLEAVHRVIITHAHVDHVGGLPEIVAATGAEVWAHSADAGLIDGSAPAPDTSHVVADVRRRLEPMLASLPADHREAILAAAGNVYPTEHVPVDLRLTGGEELGVLGGCRLLHTPGHTPGHLSLHVPARSLLIAGDLLVFENGTITASPDILATDAQRHRESVRHTSHLPIDAFVGYHGDYLAEGAATLLQSLR